MNENKYDINMDIKQPKFMGGIMAIGFVGLVIACVIEIIEMEHPPISIFIACAVGLAMGYFSFDYLKRCVFEDVPVYSTEDGRNWNAAHAYTAPFIMVTSMAITIVVLILGVMHHLNYSLHHLFHVLEIHYDLSIVSVIFFLGLVLIGGIGLTHYHQRVFRNINAGILVNE